MVIEREIRIHSLQSGKKNSQLREPGPQAHGPKPMATKHGLASSPRASTSLLSRTHTSQRNVARVTAGFPARAHQFRNGAHPPVTSYLTSFLIPQRRQRKRKPEETRRDNMIRSSRFRKDFKLKTEHRSGGVGGRQRHKRESDKSERAVGSRRLPPPRSGAPPPGRPQIRTTWGPRHQIGRKIEVIFVAAAG